MIAALQWSSLVFCLACAGSRVPAFGKGGNQALFWALLLVAVSIGLTIPMIYLAVDGVLGGQNYASLLIRFATNAVFFILGTKMAAAFRSRRGEWLIRGPVGLTALIGFSAAAVIFFVISELPESSAGLAEYRQLDTVRWYAIAARLYQAYVAICLIPAIFDAVRTARERMIRVAAGLFCVSFSIIITLAAAQASFQLPPASDLALSYVAVLSVATGLTLVWLSGLGVRHSPGRILSRFH
jgi:hypothetical protein